MKILIEEGWWGRYRFYLGDNDEPVYLATSGSSMFKGDYANIYNAQKQKVLCLKPGQSSFTKLNSLTYTIDGFPSGRTMNVNCVNYKKGHWTIRLDQGNYDIYFHGRRKKSLYKNGDQVAKFGRVNYNDFIIANSDEDVLFLVALFMTFRMGDSAPDDDVLLEICDDAKDENAQWCPVK